MRRTGHSHRAVTAVSLSLLLTRIKDLEILLPEPLRCRPLPLALPSRILHRLSLLQRQKIVYLEDGRHIATAIAVIGRRPHSDDAIVVHQLEAFLH